ncbi:MAG: hypothetical protein KBA66_06545 [Leptospiraceae bacterium]|nr:hypothetical protein [Leptospiraceae bacterium]
MKKILQIIVTALCLSVLLIGCKKGASEADIKAFLVSKEGTYGWNTTADQIGLDFFQDGRLHIQGPDGEATMWEGKWSVTGDKLTMERTDLSKTETVPVKIDGEKLILGDKTYTRYAPK